MVNTETRQAYSEVNTILNLIGNKYTDKIPSKIRDVFAREMDTEYVPEIDINKPVKEQNLKRKTIAIISALNLQYWCEDEAKKQELKEAYKQNGIKHEQELREKYNPDNIFKNKTETTVGAFREDEPVRNTLCALPTTIEPLPLYKRILNKIKGIFKR
ncbi:MAG: hypothetical protein FWC68_02005 [Oscillospiraceae bacterium]|nr:hypothetical protein [Oscillospiraceae bacterium]